MITTIILSFFGASCLASMIVFAACVASSRADRIQRDAFPLTAESSVQPARSHGQPVVARPSFTLASSAS